MGQEVLEGMAGEGAKLRLSFGGMQVVADREPDFQDSIYLVIGGHISQLKEGPGDDADYLLATVKGAGRLISKETYFNLVAGLPLVQTEEVAEDEGSDEG